FAQRLCVRSFALKHLNDFNAVGSLNQVRDRTDRDTEGSLLELRGRLAVYDPAQVATLRVRRVVFGVFLGKILEIAPALGLLQDVLSLLANLSDFGVGFPYRFEENVLHMGTIFDLVLVNVGVVISV